MPAKNKKPAENKENIDEDIASNKHEIQSDEKQKILKSQCELLAEELLKYKDQSSETAPVDQLLRPSPDSARMKAGPTCRVFRVRWGTSPAPYSSQALAPSLPQTGTSGSAAVAYVSRGALPRSWC